MVLIMDPEKSSKLNEEKSLRLSIGTMNLLKLLASHPNET